MWWNKFLFIEDLSLGRNRKLCVITSICLNMRNYLDMFNIQFDFSTILKNQFAGMCVIKEEATDAFRSPSVYHVNRFTVLGIIFLLKSVWH